MKILLTGGSGFIGRNFIEKYQNKYEIFAPTSEELDLTKIRAVADYFKDKKFDCVVHLAGKADGFTANVLEADNLIMFKNVQHETIIHGVKKLLIIGDAAEFDRSKPISDVSEESFGETIPQDAYGLGRYLIALLSSKDKITTELRFFGVYGKYQDVAASKIMEIIAKGVLPSKKPLVIDSDGEFSAVYIDDALKVIASFIDNDYEKGSYNVVHPAHLTLAAIAKIVKRLAAKDGRKPEIMIKDAVRNEYTGSGEKLAALMPKFKFTGADTGVKNVYAHLNTHKSQARPKKKKE